MALPIPCFCACHEYPGVYSTSRVKPCGGCGHVDEDGELLGTVRDGWTPRRVTVDIELDFEAIRQVAHELGALADRIEAAVGGR